MRVSCVVSSSLASPSGGIALGQSLLEHSQRSPCLPYPLQLGSCLLQCRTEIIARREPG